MFWKLWFVYNVMTWRIADPFVWRIHRWPVPIAKGPWCVALMFSLVIARASGWTKDFQMIYDPYGAHMTSKDCCANQRWIIGGRRPGWRHIYLCTRDPCCSNHTAWSTGLDPPKSPGIITVHGYTIEPLYNAIISHQILTKKHSSPLRVSYGGSFMGP